MHAYLFPGQGSQFIGMAKDLHDKYAQARKLMNGAVNILGFDILKVMFEGPEEKLQKTRITQPAIFLHSLAMIEVLGVDFKPDMVAGHSLGEFSALVASKCLSFEDGLVLVQKRADAMQQACEKEPSTMAAIIGLNDGIVEEICREVQNVVPANFNSPMQVVISGSVEGVETACKKLKTAGAKLTMPLKVDGAFHSSYMQSAGKQLEEAIQQVQFNAPACPVYQNVTAKPSTDPETIKANLIEQLTAPVLWKQTIENMIADGADEFSEIGPGRVLQGLVKKIDRNANFTP